jgi:hypothetical protein
VKRVDRGLLFIYLQILLLPTAMPSGGECRWLAAKSMNFRSKVIHPSHGAALNWEEERSVVPIVFFVALQRCFLHTVMTLISNTELVQGCQMEYFHTKNANMGIFLEALGWKSLVYFKAIWYFLWPF